MATDANPGKRLSHEVTSGYERAPARAMLRAIGMTDADWAKPQIGIASSWNEVTPCNLPLDRLAKRAKDGVREAGGFPMEFTTIAVSDGISMGHEGMRASLVSREIIADSVECVMHAERIDAMVTLAGCDKSLPGMLMASARINVPAIFLYGGSILPGRHSNGEALDMDSSTTTGRRLQNASSSLRSLRSPDSGRKSDGWESHAGPPTAPKNTASADLQASRVSSGSGAPVASIAAPPIVYSLNSNPEVFSLATASSTRLAACVTSGPTPSPGNNTIRYNVFNDSWYGVRILRGN